MIQSPQAPYTKKILVVEDDLDSRQALLMHLERAGYAVTTAGNGQEALEQLHQGLVPNLILLDLIMPVLDGPAFREVQLQDPTIASIPVIVVSGATDLQQKAISLGAVGQLEKPIDFDKLLETIRSQTNNVNRGILVADDEGPIRTLLEMALRQAGFSVWKGANGQEAVDLFRENLHKIAMVLLDVQMPILDGPGALAALKTIDPTIRCCFMSGNTGNHRPEHLVAMGADRVFQKPFRLEEVTQSILELLEQAH